MPPGSDSSLFEDELLDNGADAQNEVVVVAVLDLDDFVAYARVRGERWATSILRNVGAAIESASELYGCAGWQHDPPDDWTAVFIGSSAELLRQRALSWVQHVREQIEQEGQIAVSAGISRPHARTASVTNAAHQARSAVAAKLVRGGGCVVQEDSLDFYPAQPPRIGQELIRNLRARNRPGAARLLADWIDRCAAQPGVSPTQLQDWVISQLLVIMDLMASQRTASGSADWLSPGPDSFSKRLREITEIHELSYLRLWVEDVLDELFSAQRHTDDSPVLTQAEMYLREHFADPDLQLNSLAKRLSVSPFYLAHLFQHGRNTTFLKLLTGLRMQAARQMLTGTDRPVEQIARLVGYDSSRRFRVVFRREVGCAPIDYRRLA